MTRLIIINSTIELPPKKEEPFRTGFDFEVVGNQYGYAYVYKDYRKDGKVDVIYAEPPSNKRRIEVDGRRMDDLANFFSQVTYCITAYGYKANRQEIEDLKYLLSDIEKHYAYDDYIRRFKNTMKTLMNFHFIK